MRPHVSDRAAAAGGQVLRALTAVTAALRRADKPLHPRGSILPGSFVRHGLAERTGVDWLDEPGEDAVLVRISRAVGLPAALPDIFGLALRVPVHGGYGDLLFASTGAGRLSRFLLTVAREPGGRPMTTLLPYATPAGHVVLAATADGQDRWELAVARGAGPWQRFATLEIDSVSEGDTTLSFDPVANQIPGLEVPPWVRRLREPSYRTARRSRSTEES